MSSGNSLHTKYKIFSELLQIRLFSFFQRNAKSKFQIMQNSSSRFVVNQQLLDRFSQSIKDLKWMKGDVLLEYNLVYLLTIICWPHSHQCPLNKLKDRNEIHSKNTWFINYLILTEHQTIFFPNVLLSVLFGQLVCYWILISWNIVCYNCISWLYCKF